MDECGHYAATMHAAVMRPGETEQGDRGDGLWWSKGGGGAGGGRGEDKINGRLTAA